MNTRHAWKQAETTSQSRLGLQTALAWYHELESHQSGTMMCLSMLCMFHFTYDCVILKVHSS